MKSSPTPSSLLSKAAIATLAALAAASATAGTITTFGNRAGFNAAVGATTVEDFGTTSRFPITTGVLNSLTNLPGIGITPGFIKAGVTYSTPVGAGNFFNIDFGGQYQGGFLDGFNPSTRDVTITFDNALAAFGFDIGGLGSATFDVTINFVGGGQTSFNNLYPSRVQFFGWQSSASDILSVTVSNNGGAFGFDFDNFTFGGTPGGNQVPLPGSLALVLVALAGGALQRRRG